MAWEWVPSAIILCGIPQVYNVEQQADCGQWNKVRKIAFISYTVWLKVTVFEGYTQYNIIYSITWLGVCTYARLANVWKEAKCIATCKEFDSGIVLIAEDTFPGQYRNKAKQI